MIETARALAAKLGRLALWLMPLTVVFEWVGGTFQKSLPARFAYLSLFLALYWLSELTPITPALSLGRARKPLGALFVVGGLGMFACAVRWALWPRFGWQPFVPPEWLHGEASRLLLPIFAAWPLAIGMSWLREPAVGARSYEQLGCFVALAFLLHLYSGVRVQSLPLLALPDNHALLCVLGLAVGALALLPFGPARVRLAILLVLGFVLRARGIAVWDIDPRVRDMLALVDSAQRRFASGQDPYVFYAMQHGSELPLTYFPGLWLGYGVPRLVGLDLRFMGPLLEAAFLWLLGSIARRAEGERRAWGEAFVGCFAAVWLFSPSVQWNVIYAEPALWWGILGLTLALSFSGRWLAAALVLGYAIATRHFAIVVAPFVLLYFVRRSGIRAGLPYVALAAVVALGLLAPFVIASPELFWFGTFRWLREYGPAHITWFFDRFGFMQPFHDAGHLELLPLVQGGIVLACLVGASLSRSRARIASYAATAALLFIMFNVLLWDSFLLDGAIMAAALVVAKPQGELAPLLDASPRVFRASLGGLGLSALVGGYLAWTLVRTLHPAGRDEAHDFMISAVHQGDFVIDRSDRRVAFVQGSWLLAPHEVPAPIGGELYDGAWHGSALNAPGRVWLITQQGRDQALRSSFAQLGKPLADRDFGGYRVQAIEPARTSPLGASALPANTAVRRCPVAWMQRDMLAVQVSRDQPSVLTFPAHDQGVLLNTAVPNPEVIWPRHDVELHLAGAPAVTRNLVGLQSQAFTKLPSGPLRLELRTDDPIPRFVCVELLGL